MHKNATKCNETLRKWCKNKHGASKIMDTLETYHVHKEKPTKELVGRERETAQEKDKKHHPEATRGLGDALGAREDDLIIIEDETIGLDIGEILLLEIRGYPAGRIGSVALPHLVLLRKGLDAHLRVVYGSCAGAQKGARFSAMVAAAEARNW
jgi:hypothetical protein